MYVKKLIHASTIFSFADVNIVCFAGYLLKMTMPKCLFKNWKLVILWDVALMMILVIEKYSLPVMDQQ